MVHLGHSDLHAFLNGVSLDLHSLQMVLNALILLLEVANVLSTLKNSLINLSLVILQHLNIARRLIYFTVLMIIKAPQILNLVLEIVLLPFHSNYVRAMLLF